MPCDREHPAGRSSPCQRPAGHDGPHRAPHRSDAYRNAVWQRRTWE